jgi:hypothetical protein
VIEILPDSLLQQVSQLTVIEILPALNLFRIRNIEACL